MKTRRRTSPRQQPPGKSEEKNLIAPARKTAKRPHSHDDGGATARRAHRFPTKQKRKKQTVNSEISDKEEMDNEISDPQYVPDLDPDTDDKSAKRLSKSKVRSAAVRGRRGGGGGRGTHICFLCQNEYLKIDLHLKKHIGEDADVAQAFRLSAGSTQRKEALEKLRNRGNSLRSSGAPKAQSEAKTSARRTNDEFPPSGLSSPRRTRRAEPDGGQPEPVTSTCSSDVCDVEALKILGCVYDCSARALHKDFFLKMFAESLYSMHGHDSSKHDYIREKILELGRFVLAMRNTSTLLTLADAVKPGNFLNMVKVVKDMTGFDTAQEIPSLALRIGQSLFEVSDIVQCHALMTGDQGLVDSTVEFKKLYLAKWPEHISQNALSDEFDLTECSFTDSDTDQHTDLPPAEDVEKLHNHLDQKAKAAVAALKEQPTEHDYSSLARATLSKMILLNVGPVGEFSRMKLQSFLERKSLKREDVGLSEYEQKLCCYFQRVGLKGSGRRKVSVLLTAPLVNALDLMIGKRQECDVPDENEYLFAVPKFLTYYKGHESLALFAAECGVKKPDYLRSEQVHKQVAMASRIVSFCDNELDQLSTFLGQEITVQRRFCWQSEPTEQSARISKLLLALEKGTVHKVQGEMPHGFTDIANDEDDNESDDEKSQAGDKTIALLKKIQKDAILI